MLDGTEYFECMCHSDEHVLRVTLDLDESEKSPEHRMPCVFASVYLAPGRGFWARLWYGLKYAFGYKSKYGAFYSWMMEPKDAYKLRDLIERLPEPEPPIKMPKVKPPVTYNEVSVQDIIEELDRQKLQRGDSSQSKNSEINKATFIHWLLTPGS